MSDLLRDVSERLDRFRRGVASAVEKIPGWPTVVHVAERITAPVRALAFGVLRLFPRLRRAEWLLEIESLTRRHPVLLAFFLALALWRGLQTTNLGHIGTDLMIYPLLMSISFFNPFLGIICGVCFGAGDLLQKLVVNDIYSPAGGLATGMNRVGAILGYIVAYSALMGAGLLPGMVARVFRESVRQLLVRHHSRRMSATADGALPDPTSSFAVWELGALVAGHLITAYGYMKGIAPRLEKPAFINPIMANPDYSCYALEKNTYLTGRSGEIALKSAAGGAAIAGTAGPTRPSTEDGTGPDGPPDGGAGGGNGSSASAGPAILGATSAPTSSGSTSSGAGPTTPTQPPMRTVDTNQVVLEGEEALDVLVDMGEVTKTTNPDGTVTYHAKDPDNFPVNWNSPTPLRPSGDESYATDADGNPVGPPLVDSYIRYNGLSGLGFKVNPDGTIDPENIAIVADEEKLEPTQHPPASQFCPNCGAPMPAGAGSCGVCGQSPGAAPAGAPQQGGEERLDVVQDEDGVWWPKTPEEAKQALLDGGIMVLDPEQSGFVRDGNIQPPKPPPEGQELDALGKLQQSLAGSEVSFENNQIRVTPLNRVVLGEMLGFEIAANAGQEIVISPRVDPDSGMVTTGIAIGGEPVDDWMIAAGGDPAQPLNELLGSEMRVEDLGLDGGVIAIQTGPK